MACPPGCDLPAAVPGVDPGALYFTIDDTLHYTSFFADFGPLDINLTHKFFTIVAQKLNKAKPYQKVILYSSSHPHRKMNAAVLISAYMVCDSMSFLEWREFLFRK